MTLHLIGLGLGDEKDITINGLEAVKKSQHVFLEHYTSIFSDVDYNQLSIFYGKPVSIVSREDVEQHAEKIIGAAKNEDVSFLVIGDVFGATTHTDLLLRAKEAGVTIKYYPNASILTAVGITGLELYKFGKTTSMVFFDGDWKPTTAYDTIAENKLRGLHTLVLLDIKVAEPKKEDLLKEKYNPQKPRFMTIQDCLLQLLELESDKRKEIISEETNVIGCARIGKDNIIKYDSIKNLLSYDFGGPLHVVIVPGDLHFIEKDALQKA
jgi:diphthine synthase